MLAGQGAQIDTTTAAGCLVFGIFATLAEFERELIRERTLAELEAARARGRKGGRKFALSKAQVRLAQAAIAYRDTSVSVLCRELGISPVTLYRYVGTAGPAARAGPEGSRLLMTPACPPLNVRISPPPANNPYGRAAGQFLAWCGARGLGLRAIAPLHVAAYIRTHPGSVPTVKQHLAAIRGALRLARRASGAAREPGGVGPGPEARRHEGGDAGPDAGRDAGAPRPGRHGDATWGCGTGRS